MPTVHLRLPFSVRGKLDWRLDGVGPPRSLSMFTFFVERAHGRVSIDVDPAKDAIVARLVTEMSDSAFKSLSDWRQTRRISPEFHPEAKPVIEAIEDAVGQLVGVLRFTYPMEDFRGVRIGGLAWSLDGETWQDEPLPSRIYSTGHSFRKTSP